MSEKVIHLSTSNQNSFEFSDSKENTAKKFRGVSYSGDEINDRYVMGHDDQVYSRLVIDLAGAKEKTSKMNASMRVGVFFNHDSSVILGNGVMNFTSKNITLEGILSEHSAKAKEIYGMMKDENYPMQQSLGIWPESIEGVSSGSVEVNGRIFQAPIAVFRKSFIREISLVPIGADPQTHAEIFSIKKDSSVDIVTSDGTKKPKGETMDKFTFMSEDEKTKYSELKKTDEFAAFTFACACHAAATKEADEQAAAAAAKKKEDEENEDGTDEGDDKSDDSGKEEMKVSKKSFEKLLTEVKTMKEKISELEKAEVTIDPSFFKVEKNDKASEGTKLDKVMKRANEIKKEKNISFNVAYSQARQELV